jgi:hypothetical protein
MATISGCCRSYNDLYDLFITIINVAKSKELASLVAEEARSELI